MDAIIYTRFSPRPAKAGQDVPQSESCETQEHYCREWCEMHHHNILEVFKDEGLSAKSRDGRPGLSKALAQAKQGKRIFVAYSLSRWARSTTDAIRISEELREANCQMVSVKENLDTSNPYGRFMYTIFSALAELEREMISERTSEAMRQHQRNGRRMSDRCPFGFVRNPEMPSMMIPDPKEQDVIRRILELHNAGHGCRDIARMVSHEGHRSRSGEVMHHEIVRKVVARGLSQVAVA